MERTDEYFPNMFNVFPGPAVIYRIFHDKSYVRTSDTRSCSTLVLLVYQLLAERIVQFAEN